MTRAKRECTRATRVRGHTPFSPLVCSLYLYFYFPVCQMFKRLDLEKQLGRALLCMNGTEQLSERDWLASGGGAFPPSGGSSSSSSGSGASSSRDAQ